MNGSRTGWLLTGRGKSPPGLFPGVKTSGFRGCSAPGTSSLTCGRLFGHSLLASVVAGAVGLAGCGSGLVPAEGIVLLDGKPVAGATITFMPQAEGRPASARSGPDGRFAASLPGGPPGVSPGDYRVVVMLLKQEVLGAGGGDAETASGGGGPPVEYLVPRRYGDPETSGLTAALAKGSRDLRFELTSEPDPPSGAPQGRPGRP
jgi:hypothetical protein